MKHEHKPAGVTVLNIVSLGGKSLGRCYEETHFLVTSQYPLSAAQVLHLQLAGYLGVGQEFGEFLSASGERIAGRDGNAYTYRTWCRCDSGG